jgi:MFS family permease
MTIQMQEKASIPRLVLLARGLRAFGDGYVALLLPLYLTRLGFGPVEVGAIATVTLLGSASMTLCVGFVTHRIRPRPLLLGGAVLMMLTGVAIASTSAFWPLVVIAAVGTINPSSGDVSFFLPLEQSLLAGNVAPARRTHLFARFSLIASFAGAGGSLAAGVVDYVPVEAMFVLYGALGLGVLAVYRRLPPVTAEAAPTTPLGPSRRRVLTLAALFSLDSFGGGFVVQSLLALWLFERYDLSVATAGTIFFWTGVLSAFSYPVAAWISARIGLVNTMVFTHLPANLFLLLTPFAPTLWGAIVLLLARAALSQMDVPTRTSYVMAVVTPGERAAAASVTAVPRSLASAVSPLLAGMLLASSPFGWPLVAGGALKIVYDLLLLAMFRAVRPPEEPS